MFRQMFAFLEKKQLQIDGNIYVDVILNGLAAQKFEDFLLKLVVRVVPKKD